MDYAMAFVIGATLSLLNFKRKVVMMNWRNAKYRHGNLSILEKTVLIDWRWVAFNAFLTGLIAFSALFLYQRFA